MKISSQNKQRGMTLVEIMMAVSLGLIVMTASLRFFIQTLKSYQYETGKLMINRDIRSFTAQMIDDATYANSFQIYDQTSNLTRSSPSPVGSADPTSSTYKGYSSALTITSAADPVSASTPGTEKVASGLTGDVLVFVYNVNGDNTKIWQLIIYYRMITTSAGGTNGTNSALVSDRTKSLRRIKVSITDPTAQSAGIMKLLPDLVNVPLTYVSSVPQTMGANSTTIFAYVDGQANDVVPTGSVNRSNKMFYNLNNTSILVRGRIYENYTAQRIVKSTYNFTVTPRG